MPEDFVWTTSDETEMPEDFVWTTSDESARDAQCRYALRVLAESFGAKPEFDMKNRDGMAVNFVWPEDVSLETQIDCAEKAEKIIESFGGECC